MGLPSVPAARAIPPGTVRIDAVPRYFLTAVCAGSAGVHAALIQPHIAEGGPPLGAAFAAAAAALAFAALAVREPRHDRWAPAIATAVLCVIAVSYLLSRTTGIPLLTGQAEELDPLGAVTTAAEFAGTISGALLLMSRKDSA